MAYFFRTGIFFNMENGKYCPIFAVVSRNLALFGALFTGLNNAEMYQIEQNDKNTDTNTNKYEYKKSTWKTRMGEQMRKDISQMKKFTAATW